jgi:hypothetical protein
MWDRRSEYRIFVGTPVGIKPFARLRRRWEHNIKMDIHEVGCGGMGWILLVLYWDRWRAIVNAVMNILFLKIAGNFLSS